MSQLAVEETRPCPFNTPAGPCPGVLEAELDGQQVVWACTVCFNEQYGARLAEDEQAGSCQMGVPEAMQQHEPPSGGPVFLQIGRRPE